MDARIKSGHDGCVCGAGLRIASHTHQLQFSSLRATGSRECAPDDRLREAIHLDTQRKYGLPRFARNDVAPIPDTRSRSRGAMRPRFAFIFRPQGGRGECRVPAAPAVSCALGSGRTHTSNNEYTGTPGIPARNGFTAYFVLSPVTGLFCHRRLRNVRPVRARLGRHAIPRT